MLVAPEYVERFLPAALVQPPPPQQEQPRDKPMFVFVEPKADLPPLRQPDRVEMSDVDRSARSPEAAPKMENPLPVARGNSTQRTESSPDERMKGEGPAPTPAPPPRRRRRSKCRRSPISATPTGDDAEAADQPSAGRHAG